MPALRLRLVLLLPAAALGTSACDDGGGGSGPELCANRIDDDGDGATDCDDPDCTANPSCAPAAENCTNGVDDDGDGATDCDDSDCAAEPACVPTDEDCANGVDDDGDGATDCDDSDCTADPACVPPVEDCANGADDDGDGATDCDDADCTASPACAPRTENCRNGIDDDGDGATDCDDADCTGSADCVPSYEDCANGADDDGDGRTDCDDTADCAAAPGCAPVCNDTLDAFEPNDDIGSATPAASVAPTDTLYSVAGDADVFALDACVGGILTIDVSFLHAAGDIDIELLAADGNRLASAASADDDESLVWTGDRRGTVYLRVGMYGSAGCNTYRLATALEDAGCIWTEPDCANGIDDDGDGLTDCADAADCSADTYCLPETDCANGVDDDGDGLTDCLDPGCRATPQCTATGNDTCAAPFVLPDDPNGTWFGDTSALAGDYRGTCAGDGREAVFQFTVTTAGELTADTEGSAFDSVLYVRSGDCATGTQLACNDDVSRGIVWSSVTASLVPGTYTLFVDGFDAGANGPYRLNVGFRIVELCDDGVDNDGDGAIDCGDLDCAVDAACYPATCVEDAHEDNDTLATALPITDISPADALAVTPSDDDFWSIEVCDGAIVTIDCRFLHADGDVDIYLQDASGAELARSNGAADNEYISWTATSTATVYLRIDLYGTRDPCNVYRLGVDVNRTACP
jgi:hypothetical protein